MTIPECCPLSDRHVQMCWWPLRFKDSTEKEEANIPWWRHQMETFSASLAICEGNSTVTGEFPAQRPVTRSFDVFFDPRLNNGWVNNREAGDLRRHCARYDFTAMLTFAWPLRFIRPHTILFCYTASISVSIKGNPFVTGGFPSQRTRNAEL